MKSLNFLGAEAVFGTPESLRSASNGVFKRFIALSGDFPISGIALPLGRSVLTRSAIRALYLHKGKSLVSKIKIMLLRLGAPFLGLIFQKQFILSFNLSRENFLSFLATKLGIPQNQLGFSMYVGSRKFIFPLFEENNGKILGVAKIYFPGNESLAYGENETRILKYLNSLNLTHFSFPKVLSVDYFQNSLVEILSSPANLKRIQRLEETHINFLKQLSNETGSKKIFSHSGFSEEFNKQLDFLKLKIPHEFSLVRYFSEKALECLRDTEFIFGLTKREFPYFEVMRTRDLFFVIDWEHARLDFPPIFDVFSLLISEAPHKRGDYIELYEKNIKDLFFGENSRSKGVLNDFLKFWNINKENAYHFFILFLIDQLYIHLHVDHNLSAERIINFLKKMQDNEEVFYKNWL